MKKDMNHFNPMLDPLREAPTELSAQEVDKMVLAFPLMPTPFDWTSIFTFKSILMTSISTLFIAGAISLLSGDERSNTSQTNHYQEESFTEENLAITENPQNNEDESTTTALPFSEDEPQTNPESPAPIDRRLPHVLPNEAHDPLMNPVEIPPVDIPSSDKTFDVRDFDSVHLSCPADAVIKQGDRFSVSAVGDEDLIEKLDIYVKNGSLKIDTKKENWGWNSNYKQTTITVIMPTLEALSLSGSGNMTFQGFNEASSLDLSLAGSGDIIGNSDIRVKNSIHASIAGSGDIAISGSTDLLKVSIAGSGDFSGKNCKSKTANVSIAGSGDVGLECEEELDVSIAGSGDVNFSGNAKVKKSVIGSGDVNRQ